MTPLKLLDNFKYKWLFSSYLFDIGFGKNARPFLLLCDLVHMGLVLSSVGGGVGGVSTSSIVEEGD